MTDLKNDPDLDRMLQAATCPVCGGSADSQYAEGWTNAGIKFGSGARRSKCGNGHVWKSDGYGKPFVVVVGEVGEQAGPPTWRYVLLTGSCLFLVAVLFALGVSLNDGP